MEQQTIDLLFALLRFALCDTPLSDAQKALYSGEQLPQLLELAKQHDLLHLICLGLRKNFPAFADDPQMKRSVIRGAYRYEQLNTALEKMCDALEATGIPHMPLKGSVIRRHYPEPWMRSSCDVDVLVREEQVEEAAAVLVEQCGFQYLHKGPHDISMLTPNQQHIELHYKLVEDGFANQASKVLATVWDTAVVREGYQYGYEMPDEMFYFYHIAHMAKHVEYGGCGIRTFMDLWILNRLENADWIRRETLLRQGGLLKFADAASRLSDSWFGGKEMDPVSRQLEDFILRGGVYGTSTNCILVQQQKKGGKLQYVLSRVFAPYDELKFEYPILQRYRWLTPVMEVARWLRWIFGKDRDRTMRKLIRNYQVSPDETDTARELMHHIGL